MKPILRPFRASAFGFALGLLAFGCGEDPPKQGELMLVVTSDLAVPNDIDRLVWLVTLQGEETPFAKETVVLESGSDLPVTLAIQAGPRTRAPVTVRVEGRKGVSPSLLRVAREARVVVPTSRVAELKLPLSWLCSDANLSAACEPGSTCQAGHCVDAGVSAASLPDFQPPPALACNDVMACLPSATLAPVGPITLESGAEVACGLTGTKLLGSDADVNLALVVANERVGNYGFCGPFEQCFIPLQRDDTPEGWQVLENGATPALQLPVAICENLSKSVSRVAVVRASPSCPSDQAERPLCSPPRARGCLSAPVCPGASSDAGWVGFACTDASPNDTHPELLDCWSPKAPTTEGSTPSDGRWCCLEGQASSDDPLLIDDMQAGPQIKRPAPEGSFAGWWYTDVPDGSGDLSPAPDPSLYTYRTLPEPVTPAGGPTIRSAACLSSRGFRGWLALEGFFFSGKLGSRQGAEQLDVSRYAGISFWGWADEPFPDAPLTVEVNFPNTQTSTEPDSACTLASGPKQCENFFSRVSLTSTWQQYFVRWEDLAQSEQDWGQVRFDEFEPRVESVYFAVRGAGPQFLSQPFDFCVADVRFEEKPESSP